VQVFKQWPIYFIGRILPAAIGFSGIALYTRMLDPASFGIYALLLSTSFLIGMVGFSWLRVATLRIMTSIAPADEPDFAATIALSFVVASILVAATTICVLRISAPAVPLSSELLTAAGAIASGWFELNVSVAQARMRLITYGLLQAARAVGALVSSVLLIVAGLKANALLGGFAIGNCAGLFFLAPWQPALRGAFRVKILRELFHFGWPSSAASLTYFTTMFQRFVLTVAGGSAAVGVFAAASDFSQQTVGLLIGTAMIAGQPLAFRARDLGTPHELSEQLRNNARLVFGVGLGAAAGLISLAVPLAHLYFGPKFQSNAALLLAISAAAVFLSGVRGYYFEQAFEITRNTRPMAFTAGLRIVMTIVLSTLLIGRFAAVGAGLATLFTEIFGLALSVVWARRLMHVPVPLGSFAKIAAATAAMVCVLELMPSRSGLWGLVLAILAGILTYGASLAIMHRRQFYALLGLHQPVTGLTRT
jgi:O-antigen/teichoic acid export membrane protein